MNKRTLFTYAAMMGAMMNEYHRCYKLDPESRLQTNMPKERDMKQLREYTYKGHKIMAYSKTDAKFRLRREGKI